MSEDDEDEAILERLFVSNAGNFSFLIGEAFAIFDFERKLAGASGFISFLEALFSSLKLTFILFSGNKTEFGGFLLTTIPPFGPLHSSSFASLLSSVFAGFVSFYAYDLE